MKSAFNKIEGLPSKRWQAPFIEGPVECEMIHLNDRVAVNIGPGEQVVGIEVLDASDLLEGLKEGKVKLENLTPAL